jgi:hypothetical protein
MVKMSFQPLIAITVIAILASGAMATDRYLADFEEPTFHLGVLAGETYISGQDGWVATGDLDHEPVFSDIVVQDRIVNSDLRAAEVIAANQQAAFINIWENVQFDPIAENEPYVYVDLDFYIADNATRSEAWGMGIQSLVTTGITKWLVWDDNSIKIMDPSLQGWLDTGYDITRNSWHHMQTYIDYTAMTVNLFYDGQLIATVGTWDNVEYFAFASIYLGAPGADTFYFDNYKIRSFSISDIENNRIVKPSQITLDQNYPNPFNAQTAINYTMPVDDNVSLDIFDILGKKIVTVADGFQSAGAHRVIWNANPYPSGIYFYKLSIGQLTQTKSMILIK